MPKNRFFRHISGIFGRKNMFFKNRARSHFGHCHFASLCQKPEKTNDPILRKAGNRQMVKGNFPKKRKSLIYSKKKFSREKFFRPFFKTHCPLSFCQKSEKTNEAILRKVQKTLFLGSFWPKFAQKIFFSKIGLRHFLGIAILHLCAKNQKKLMSQSPEKLVTDERTNGRTNIG